MPAIVKQLKCGNVILCRSSYRDCEVPSEDRSRTESTLAKVQEGKMSAKEELVKALVHVRQSWVETTGGTEIFRSANVALGHDDILVIPATHWDISDQYFVEVTFYPRALEHQPAKSIKAFIPKEAVILIVELKSPNGMSALGYKKVAGE